MSEAPKRAWMFVDEDGDLLGYQHPRDDLIEYVRADLAGLPDELADWLVADYASGPKHEKWCPKVSGLTNECRCTRGLLFAIRAWHEGRKS